MRKGKLRVILLILLLSITGSHASGKTLPVIDGQEVVATVNGEPVTLAEFKMVLASFHSQMVDTTNTGKIDFAEPLQRLINSRLIILEARNMGLDDLPEFKDKVKKYSQNLLIKTFLSIRFMDLVPDEDEVNKLYEDTVKEWKLKSISFDAEDDAKLAAAELKKGMHFDSIAEKLITDGKAKGSYTGEYVRNRDLLPVLKDFLVKMTIGSVSPVLQTEKGFTILKLEETRIPEDPEAKDNARRTILLRERNRAKKGYYKELKEKYVKVHESTLDNLNYESKGPSFEVLLKDSRVLADVAGDNPITIGDLTKQLKDKFYHGVEGAITSKRVNAIKRKEFDILLERKVFTIEALKQGIDKSERYVVGLENYENSLLFNSILQKSIIPEINLGEGELKKYYEENMEKYTSPDMMKVKSISFTEKSDAENALEKLRRGTDFNWMRTHAEGQVDNASEGFIELDSKPLLISSFPEGIRNVLNSAKSGDLRLYDSPENYHYVLFIQEVFPPKPIPFENVRKEIYKEIFQIKILNAIQEYADKLRDFYEVKIYATDQLK